MRRLNLHCISPQYESLSDISFRQSKIASNIKRIHLLGQYSKTHANAFSELRDIQMGNKYLELIHIEENGNWFNTDFNKPMLLMIICENNYGDKPMDMKELADMTIAKAYFSPKTYDTWLDNIDNY